jgi:RNA recognition motif-containing protein
MAKQIPINSVDEEELIDIDVLSAEEETVVAHESRAPYDRNLETSELTKQTSQDVVVDFDTVNDKEVEEQKNEMDQTGSSNVLYVKNIPLTAREEDLETLFSDYGKVHHVDIIYDPYTNESRGFAFVEFATSNDATKALNNMTGIQLRGKMLYVERARRGRPRSPTPGKYSGVKKDIGPSRSRESYPFYPSMMHPSMFPYPPYGYPSFIPPIQQQPLDYSRRDESISLITNPERQDIIKENQRNIRKDEPTPLPSSDHPRKIEPIPPFDYERKNEPMPPSRFEYERKNELLPPPIDYERQREEPMSHFDYEQKDYHLNNGRRDHPMHHHHPSFEYGRHDYQRENPTHHVDYYRRADRQDERNRYSPSLPYRESYSRSRDTPSYSPRRQNHPLPSYHMKRGSSHGRSASPHRDYYAPYNNSHTPYYSSHPSAVPPSRDYYTPHERSRSFLRSRPYSRRSPSHHFTMTPPH